MGQQSSQLKNALSEHRFKVGDLVDVQDINGTSIRWFQGIITLMNHNTYRIHYQGRAFDEDVEYGIYSTAIRDVGTYTCTSAVGKSGRFFRAGDMVNAYFKPMLICSVNQDGYRLDNGRFVNKEQCGVLSDPNPEWQFDELIKHPLVLPNKRTTYSKIESLLILQEQCHNEWSKTFNIEPFNLPLADTKFEVVRTLDKSIIYQAQLHRQILALHSNFFRTVFFGPFQSTSPPLEEKTPPPPPCEPLSLDEKSPPPPPSLPPPCLQPPCEPLTLDEKTPNSSCPFHLSTYTLELDIQNAESIDAVIRFIYTGQVKLESNIFLEVYHLADYLNLTHLQTILDTFSLDTCFDVKNIVQLWIQASSYSLTHLASKMETFIFNNLQQICDSSLDEKIMFQMPFPLLQQIVGLVREKADINQDIIYKHLKTWKIRHEEVASDIFHDFLKNQICWSRMPISFLVDVVKSDGILSDSQFLNVLLYLSSKDQQDQYAHAEPGLLLK